MHDEGLAAMLGLVLVHLGGEVEIPIETIEAGLPENSGVRVVETENGVIFRIQEYDPDEQ